MKSLCLLLSFLTSTLMALPPVTASLTTGQKKATTTGLLNLDFVTVGDAGNPADSNGHGAVAEVFQIGKTDIKAVDYCQFLNAVASKSDPYALYHEKMASNPSVASITRKKESDGSFTYSTKNTTANLPIAYVTWFSAARFCNWLHNGQPIGDEDATSTETGAYTLNGAMKDESGSAVTPQSDYCKLNEGAKFFIPTEDQWYKAAYYKGNGSTEYWSYPTKSDVAPDNQNKGYANAANYVIESKPDDSHSFPWYWNYQYSNGGKSPFITAVGLFKESPGPYGTFDMGGNLFQWVSNTGYSGTRVIRGGSWKKQHHDELNKSTCVTVNPAMGYDFVGFRIAAPAL